MRLRIISIGLFLFLFSKLALASTSAQELFEWGENIYRQDLGKGRYDLLKYDPSSTKWQIVENVHPFDEDFPAYIGNGRVFLANAANRKSYRILDLKKIKIS